jgi:hypothetical protein
MAARQDQTLQIALIVFAIFTVVLAGFTYWSAKQAGDADQALTAMREEKNTADTKANNTQVQNEELRKLLGFDQFAEYDTVVAPQSKTDLDRMLGTMAEEKRNYRDGLQLVYAENQQLSTAQAGDKEKLKQLEAKLAEVEAGHQAQIARLEADKAKIEQAAAAERNQFAQARAQLDAKQKELAAQIAKQTDDFEKEKAELMAARDAAQEEANKRQQTINTFIDDRAQEEFSFEVADGKITYVNQANNTVWIDLGAADALRQQVTFSVFDTADTDAGKAEKKGSIEVVRMLGPHMAEARVTDDDARNPILPGDFIYSQVWNVGKPQHFALTGLIDLDGDGRSDLQLAKDMIDLNGGIVDAAPNPETGEQEGQMSLDTRYMVFGERSDKTNDTALRKTWDDMHGEANALGVQLISVTDFINQMGYKPQDRAVNMGSGGNSRDFRPRPAPASGDLRPRVNYSAP